MPRKVPAPFGSTAKSALIHPERSEPTPKKRCRNEQGTKSSLYVIESDGEDQLRAEKPKKRTKFSGGLQDRAQAPIRASTQAAFQTTEDGSSRLAMTKTKSLQDQRRYTLTDTALVTAAVPTHHAAAPAAPYEHSDYTKMREAEFMRSFKTKYWLGGFSIRDAILEVNAGNRLFTMCFTQEEGVRRLHSLAGQGKLVIENELVYHLDQAPAPIAPPLKPAEKSEPMIATHRITEKPSIYGRISAARFEVFECQLKARVQGGHLFNNERKEDTLGDCLTHLNKDLGGPGEDERLSLKEISAAFVHLQKIKHVALKGESIKFIERGQVKLSKRR
ncbi:hypothetical protein N0V95_008367 [Ascochyta clinopodiicola]|nr:hypothetical protein N0V95_008367 [Ascochyta clinopodiicola]